MINNAVCPTRPPGTFTATKQKTCVAYNGIKKDFDDLVASLPNDLARANLYGAAVRVVFHDAGEVDLQQPSDLLGPDGCLSQSTDNAGLEEATSLVFTTLE